MSKLLVSIGLIVKTIQLDRVLSSLVLIKELNEGLYFVRISDGNQVLNQRFTINR